MLTITTMMYITITPLHSVVILGTIVVHIRSYLSYMYALPFKLAVLQFCFQVLFVLQLLILGKWEWCITTLLRHQQPPQVELDRKLLVCKPHRVQSLKNSPLVIYSWSIKTGLPPVSILLETIRLICYYRQTVYSHKVATLDILSDV